MYSVFFWDLFESILSRSMPLVTTPGLRVCIKMDLAAPSSAMNGIDLPPKPQLVTGEAWRSPVQIFFKYAASSLAL